MKKFFILFLLVLFAFCTALAETITVGPGLAAPLGGDGARVDAAVLVSTNATATSTVKAVYELPVYGLADFVFTNVYETAGWVTNNIVITNFSASVTSNFVVSTVYGLTTTNYYTVATNKVASYVAIPGAPVITTNRVWAATSTVAVTNNLFALTASGGFAETNAIDRCLAPGARLLVTGAPVTIFLK